MATTGEATGGQIAIRPNDADFMQEFVGGWTRDFRQNVVEAIQLLNREDDARDEQERQDAIRKAAEREEEGRAHHAYKWNHLNLSLKGRNWKHIKWKHIRRRKVWVPVCSFPGDSVYKHIRCIHAQMWRLWESDATYQQLYADWPWLPRILSKPEEFVDQWHQFRRRHITLQDAPRVQVVTSSDDDISNDGDSGENDSTDATHADVVEEDD